MNQSVKNEFKRRLEKCSTVSEMLHVANEMFETNTKLGIVSKPLFITGMVKGLEMVNPPLKKEKTHTH